MREHGIHDTAGEDAECRKQAGVHGRIIARLRGLVTGLNRFRRRVTTSREVIGDAPSQGSAISTALLSTLRCGPDGSRMEPISQLVVAGR